MPAGVGYDDEGLRRIADEAFRRGVPQAQLDTWVNTKLPENQRARFMQHFDSARIHGQPAAPQAQALVGGGGRQVTDNPGQIEDALLGVGGQFVRPQDRERLIRMLPLSQMGMIRGEMRSRLLEGLDEGALATFAGRIPIPTPHPDVMRYYIP